MSVQSEITRINDNITNAYSTISTKGGTLPQTQNSANLASSIQSIPSGGGTDLPDNPETDGSYKLVNTIATDSETEEQTSELSWEEDKDYTGSDNVYIKNQNIYGAFPFDLFNFFTFGTANNSLLPSIRSTTVSQTIEYLRTYGYCVANIFTNSQQIVNSMSEITQVCHTVNTLQNGMVYWTYGTVQIENNSFLFFKNGTLYVIPNSNIYLFGNYIGFKSTQGLTSTRLAQGIDELATTRIADTLVSTETTPTTNNTINWQYE